jgi:hypothetical protein
MRVWTEKNEILERDDQLNTLSISYTAQEKYHSIAELIDPQEELAELRFSTLGRFMISKF